MIIEASRRRLFLTLILSFLILTIPALGITPEEEAKILAALPGKSTVKPEKPRKLLVFSLCHGFAHSSIPYCAKTLELMGRKTGAFQVDHSIDLNVFTRDRLARYDAVCFNNTTRLKITDEQKKALLEYIEAGGGIVGIHAATDNFYDWPEGARLMGGLFDGHPWNEKVGVKLDDPTHPVNAAFGGKGFDVADEIYMFKDPYTRKDLRILLSLDVTRTDMTKKGIKREDGDFAVSWVRGYGKGKLFYCSP